jgi:hypothetical protein
MSINLKVNLIIEVWTHSRKKPMLTNISLLMSVKSHSLGFFVILMNNQIERQLFL